MSSFDKAQPKRVLGRGLGSLLGGLDILEDKPLAKKEIELPQTKPIAVAVAVTDEARIWNVAIEKIHANPTQPRKYFDPTKLQELANSIKEKGIIQPIIVRKSPKGFEIIAGERRWRAAQMAGAHEIPVILKQASDQDTLELALIENIQRHDLNPLEESESYDVLSTRFGLTQEQIAQKVGKERATITNALRILQLMPEVKKMVREGALSAGHAKALLSLSESSKQLEAAKRIAQLKLSVRAAETLVKNMNLPKQGEPEIALNISSRLVNSLSDELQKVLGTKVQIAYAQGKGQLAIHFYSDEELTQIVERLRKTWKN